MNAATLWLVAATHWMLLHGPEGQLYWVNMEQVTVLRAPIPSDLQRMAKGVRCIVTSTNEKFFAPVVESCEQVYQLIMSAR